MQGLQKKKKKKKKKNKDLLKLANIWTITMSLLSAEPATRKCSLKSVFKIAQNSEENLFARVSLLKE